MLQIKVAIELASLQLPFKQALLTAARLGAEAVEIDGRNELAVIRICETYVRAQKAYASRGHDGKPAGIYARRFSSDPGTENGLYWPHQPGGARSPLGDLVAEAAAEGRAIGPGTAGPRPFHGYYFRILEGQGAAAAGGAKSYVVKGEMNGGFAMIAWPSPSGRVTLVE